MLRICRFRSKLLIFKAFICLWIIREIIFILFGPADVSKSKYSEYDYNMSKWISRFTLNTCHLPEFVPFSDEVKPFVSPTFPFRCPETANPIGIKVFDMVKGTRLLKKISTEYDNGDCCYRPFFRDNDQRESVSGDCFKIHNLTTEIPVEYEFLEIFCSGQTDYADGFAIVSSDKMKSGETSKTSEEAKSDLLRLKQHRKLNVIVLGLDATSRMNFMRQMPKTRLYLINNLSAVEMKGYTKVAENTLPNIVPLLTGLTLEEMKRKCVVDVGYYTSIDSCPFVWKNFSADGYVTSYAEDDVDIGNFNLKWKLAFENPPTDFYFRPFAQRMQRLHSSHPHQCLGTRLSFQTLLDNIENVAVAMKDYSSYFQYTWSTRISHDDINRLSLGDDPLLRTLMYLNDNGYLQNTALLVLSDHGSRLDDGIRSTEQGKLEDRLPMLYIAMPSWFKDEHPVAWENLQSNSERLTSPFDVFETFRDFTQLDTLRTRLSRRKKREIASSNFSSTSLRRPSSLFKQLSRNRTCLEAGISMHWCACFNKTPLSYDSEDAVAGATFVVDHINSMLSSQWRCYTLSLHWIIEVFEVHKEEIVWKQNTSVQSKDMVRMLHIAFETKPGGANFEATVIKVNDEWGITEKPARINAYEGQSNCVEQDYKPFCYCWI